MQPPPSDVCVAAMAPRTLPDWLCGSHIAGRMLVAAYFGNVCVVGKDPVRARAFQLWRGSTGVGCGMWDVGCWLGGVLSILGLEIGRAHV